MQWVDYCDQRLVLFGFGVFHLRCQSSEASVATQRALEQKSLYPWLGMQSSLLALPFACSMISEACL